MKIELNLFSTIYSEVKVGFKITSGKNPSWKDCYFNNKILQPNLLYHNSHKKQRVLINIEFPEGAVNPKKIRRCLRFSGALAFVHLVLFVIFEPLLACLHFFHPMFCKFKGNGELVK